MPAIRTDGLAKRYPGGVQALVAIDLAVPHGDIFGLLGPNGAGKTTLIRILLDIIRPSGGHAEILGFDTQTQAVEARRHVGYLPSSPRFYAHMTAADMLDFITRARSIEPDRRYLGSLIDRLALDPSRPIHTLSRGNQQKVGLIVALMAKPDVVILDEPTTGLDPLVQEAVLEIVREVAKEGRTVFFSSHILHEVEHVCRRVAVLRAGELVGSFDLAEERRLAPRRVTVTFGAPVPADAFEGVPGVRVLAVEGLRVVFEAPHGIDALVKRLGSYTVAEIESHEPTLEDFFFALYQAPAGTSAGDHQAPRSESS